MPIAQVAPPQTLVFRGKLTEQDAVDIQRYRDLLVLGKGIRRLAASVLLGISMLFAIGMFLGKPQVGGVLFLGVWIVGVYYALVYFPMQRLRMVRKQYRKHVESFNESTVTLSPERVLIDNPNVRSNLDWRVIRIVGDSPAGLLFCAADFHVYFWLPQRLLSAESKQLTLKWAEHKGVIIRTL